MRLRDCGRLTSVCERFYSLLFSLRTMQVPYLCGKRGLWSGLLIRLDWMGGSVKLRVRSAAAA
jgi:hypothetical protein